MNTTLSFYLRHDLNQDIQGPFTITELRRHLKSIPLSDTAQIIPAKGQSLGALRLSKAWVSASSMVQSDTEAPHEAPLSSEALKLTHHPLFGYAGWLAFFGNITIYVNPLFYVIGILMLVEVPNEVWEQEAAAMMLSLIELAGYGVILYLGIQAALALRRLDPNGVSQAKTFLCWDLLWSFTVIFFSFAGSTENAREIFFAISIKAFVQTLIGSGIWFTYFNVSKRVEVTYSISLDHPPLSSSDAKSIPQESPATDSDKSSPSATDEDLPETRHWMSIPALKDIPNLGNSGKTKAALELLDQAEWAPSEIGKDLSDFAFIHSWRIRLLIRDGRQTEAKAALNRGLSSARQKSLLCNSYATTLFNIKGDLEESITWWIKSAALQSRAQRWTANEPFLYLAALAELLKEQGLSKKLYACADEAADHPDLRLNSEAKADLCNRLQQLHANGGTESVRAQLAALKL